MGSVCGLLSNHELIENNQNNISPIINDSKYNNNFDWIIEPNIIYFDYDE